MIVSAHAGYPRWVSSGANFIEIDVRRDDRGRIIDSHDEPVPGEQPATLDEILEALDGRIGLHLDMKEPGYEVELVGRALEKLPANRIVATPDFEESIQIIKQNFPEIRVSPIDFIAVDRRYMNRTYARPVWVWTVDDKREMKRYMQDARVEGIITNRPDIALKFRGPREVTA